jgi:hypothetical protein
MANWIVLMGLLLGPLVLQQNPEEKKTDLPPAPPPYVERVQRQFNFLPGGKVQITAGVPGYVKLVGWQRSSIMLEAEKVIANVAPEQAKVLSDQYPVSVRWSETLSVIRTAGPPRSVAAMDVNLVLYVPKAKTDINVTLVQGDLAIGVINGWVEATVNEGNITAKSMSGYFSALTRKGDVNVEMSGKRWEGHGFTAATQNGSVTLRLPAEYSCALQLETHNGEISIDYPAQVVEGEVQPLQVTGRKSAHSVTATVGDGGWPVRLVTNAGPVRLETLAIEVPLPQAPKQ